MLTDEVPLPLSERTGDVDRALALDVANRLRHRVLRWNRDQHVNVIGHHVALLDAALLLLRKLPEHHTEMTAQGAV